MLRSVSGMKRKIIIVDDNEINRGILISILEEDYQIIEAENGQEALDILRHEKESISAVLLDIIMPVMDGYTFLEIIRKEPEYHLLPIIVMTTQDDDDTEIKALHMGASDFLTKPYKPSIIQHRLSNLIKYRENAAFVNSIERDKLTQIYNKEFFYHRCERVLALSQDQTYMVIYANIEKFKLINDLFGPRIGDKMLKQMASAIIQNVAGKENAYFGRLNADHFGIFINEKDYKEELLQNITAELRMKHPTVVIRYGIYKIEEPRMSIDIMFDRAKLAINSIKGKYGQYFAYYDHSIREEMLQEQFLTSAMKDALKNNEFKIYLQPKYNLSDHKIIGAEALVRWIHPQAGMLAPNKFIPLFEKNGFITELDMYVWEVACQYLHTWMKEGKTLVPISVNVSRVDVYHPDLFTKLKSLVEQYEIPVEYLHLEITESAYTKDNSQLIQVVRQLRAYGFIMEMDDFGAGYSSLNMLTELPIDVLKLDMRFLNNKEERKGNILLKFVINLAKQLKLRIVAEGVETKHQELMLLQFGCDYGQGYVFSKPIPFDEFNALKEKVQVTAVKKAIEEFKYSNINDVDVEDILNDIDVPFYICKDDTIVYMNNAAERIRSMLVDCLEYQSIVVNEKSEIVYRVQVAGDNAIIFELEVLHQNQEVYKIYIFQFSK